MLSELVDRTYDSTMRHGDVLRIPDRSNPAVRIKSEDAAATWANIAETQQSITVNRQAYCAFLVEDIADIQASWDIRKEYTDASAYSLMAFVEGDLTSGLVGLADNFSQTTGTLTVDPSDDDWIDAVELLDRGDVPRNSRFIYASTSHHASLLKIDKFTREDYVGPENSRKAVLEARVGKIYGCPVYVSSLANGNPSATGQSYSWLCHRRGVVLIIQRNPTPHVDYVILETGAGVLVDVIFQHAERLIAPSTLGGGTSDDRFNVAVAGS